MNEPGFPDLIATEGPRRGLITRAVLLTLAALAFVLGFVLWLIPVVTGIPFHILALALLGMSSRRVGRWINRRERSLPHRYRVRLRKLLRKPIARS